MNKLLAFVGFVVLACSSQAQFAQPAKEISDLKWMIGTWETKGKFAMQGQEMDMEMTWTVTMDGPFIKGVSKQTIMGLDISETSFMYYDSVKKEIVSHSYANLSDMPRVERGKPESNQITLFSDPWMVMEQATLSRSTLKRINDDELMFKLEFKEEGNWVLASESSFKRKKG